MAGDRDLLLLKGDLSFKTQLFVVVCFLLNLTINGQSEFSVSNLYIYIIMRNESVGSICERLNFDILVLSRSAQDCNK